MRKYNNSVPSMMITSGEGKVVYNNSIQVEIKTFMEYIEKLLIGESILPEMNFQPFVKQEIMTKKIKLSSVISKENFKDLDGKDVEIDYHGKPTVLFFWMDGSIPETLERDMSILEESYQKNKSKINYYTVVMAKKKEDVLKLLGDHNCSVPTLFANGVALKYTSIFPSVVVIDGQGIVRFRPRKFDSEILESIMTNSLKPYKSLPEPQNADEWVKRGELLAKNENYEEAVDAYDKCLNINNKFYKAIVGRGDAYKEMLIRESAYEDYSSALELNPSDIGVYYKRAELLSQMHQFTKMIADYNKIIEIDSKSIKAYLYRGNYYFSNIQLDLAVADYTKVIEINNKEPEAFIKRGECYLLMKRYTEAIADYNSANLLNPVDTKSFVGRGIAYLKQGQISNSIIEFSNSIKIKPEANTYYLRSIAYYQQGKSDLAIFDLTKCIELNPHEYWGYYQRGFLHHLRKEEIEAINDFTMAAKFSPRNGEIVFALAQALEKNQEQNEALDAYKLALEYLPSYKTDKVKKSKSRLAGDWDSYQDWI